MNNRVNVNVDEIKIKLHTIFKGVSVPKQDAEIVINALLDAETSGVESHGLMRMKAYVDSFVELKIAANPIIVFIFSKVSCSSFATAYTKFISQHRLKIDASEIFSKPVECQ